MSTGKVGVRLPRMRRASSSTGAEPCGDGREQRPLRDKDINSVCNSDTGDEGNGNSTSRSRRRTASRARTLSKEESSRGMDIDMPVYVGGSNLVLQATVPGSREPSMIANGNEIQYRRCCFFWTCCCRCSCLNVKHHNQDPLPKGNRLEHVNGENDRLPTSEEVRSWGESFDRLMKCPVGRKVFREFLKCEYSEENILFWQACEDLKREKTPSVVEEKARLIYEDYISILSPKEVSLDSRVREVINRNMIDPNAKTFDEAQTQIYTLMHRDSYPRFINSSHYKRLAQLNNNGSGSSGSKREGSS